ncbi:MAG: hypothetical protein F6K50_48940, partial [Moorea sp. SIO3I7]|nr:hypothetical protein [Moorena sp. SIO3I7]
MRYIQCQPHGNRKPCSPHSLLPTPYSLLPTPYSLFPFPCSLSQKSLLMGQLQ